MKVILDLEANSLTNPTKIHVVVCKDIATGKIYVFRDKDSFVSFFREVRVVVGHSITDYDLPVLALVWNISFDSSYPNAIDTLIVSKLVNYSRPTGHSLESYGDEFGLPKLDNKATGFFSQWSQELEDYCVRDVEVNHRVYQRYVPILDNPDWYSSLLLEHNFKQVCMALHRNGFAFDVKFANSLLAKVTEELCTLDKEMQHAFPPRCVPGKKILPRLTKYGTLNKNDFRWYKGEDLSDFNGGEFQLFSYREFNPSSHKQIVEVLSEAGWSPTERTKTHIDLERELARNKHSKMGNPGFEQKVISDRLEILKKTGWKVNEKNLETLPLSAPTPARLLAKRILLESRRRTLTEWLGLVCDDGRIHGKFMGIGAWTHRMAHQEPNTANIPNPLKENGEPKLLGKELRSCWRAPRKRLLVGVDAEGIQLRIFAHYIDDKQFTEAIVHGRKDNKTDPHSLNGAVLGCPRQQAKRFIYALLLGAGIGKLADILGCGKDQAQEALGRLLKRYNGFDYLRREVIPSDAKRGYFTGLDGRRVNIPGDTAGERRHLCMSGYLQNGEAIIMKRACLKWHDKLTDHQAMLVNFVHDEWQTETPNNMEIALSVAKIQADSLREVGEELNLKCPMAGSFYNDDIKDYTIGTSWYTTH